MPYIAHTCTWCNTQVKDKIARTKKVLLKASVLIICAQMDLAGRAQGPLIMSVVSLWKQLPSPGTTHLGTVLGPPQHR